MPFGPPRVCLLRMWLLWACGASARDVRAGGMVALSLFALVAAGCGGGADPEARDRSAAGTPAQADGQADRRDPDAHPDNDAAPDNEPESSPRFAAAGASEPLPPVEGEPEPQTADLVEPAAAPNEPAASDSTAALPPALRPRPLRADLSVSELEKFLAEADQQMHRIATGAAGIMDEEQALAAMRAVVEQKLEAARRLASHEQAEPAQQIEGRRGELQALSHLASLGDLASAEELEQLAESYLESEDESLRTDSRMVGLGFAIESLRHGRPGAAEEIAAQVDQLAAEVSDTNLPAMVVMGQAREVLDLYGYEEPARRVRTVIVEHFGESDDPGIASMAAELAGTVRYDQIDPLRAAAVSGDEVSEDQWRQAVADLIEASSDILTVRYLAGAALELEGAERVDLAEITYEQLQQSFSDPSLARDREARMALAARDARREVIGRPFDPDLPTVDGSPLAFDSFRGKVVLMPFWDSRFPDSLQLLKPLKDIRESFPERVAVVGMNLDLESTSSDDLQAFAEQVGIDFPSYRSESSPTAAVANQVAQRFGLVSLPFTVIFDTRGRVAAIDLSGEKLRSTVEKLLDENSLDQ